MTRDERIRAVALAIVAKRYPHLSHEDHVQLAANRLDEASAALDTADATRRRHQHTHLCQVPGCPLGEYLAEEAKIHG